MQRVAVIDYGMGNLRSVAKALELVAAGSAEVVVSVVIAVEMSQHVEVELGGHAGAVVVSALDNCRVGL